VQHIEASGSIESGILACNTCSKEFPIEDGIPHFIRYEELTGLNRRFARLYDWFSYVYVPVTKIAYGLIGGEESSRREVLDRLAPSHGRVLEVSIGPGVNLPFLVGAPGVDEVYGLDISLGQLRRCRRFCRKRGWSVDLFLGNAEELPFADESFASVFHIGGINFFNDKKKAIEEMIRVAQHGAKIIIADEKERGARLYAATIPGFRRIFKGERETVTAPLELVLPEMTDVRLTDVWRGWGYCLEFCKP
jgi:ubiquinone/menaquinone biosynthesis C-methylase UbiE